MGCHAPFGDEMREVVTDGEGSLPRIADGRCEQGVEALHDEGRERRRLLGDDPGVDEEGLAATSRRRTADGPEAPQRTDARGTLRSEWYAAQEEGQRAEVCVRAKLRAKSEEVSRRPEEASGKSTACALARADAERTEALASVRVAMAGSQAAKPRVCLARATAAAPITEGK